MLNHLKQWSLHNLRLLNWGLIVGSVVLCSLAMPVRLPSMELAGIGPNWLLIWVVTWSMKRNVVQGALAGLVLGWIQDSLTAPHPTHAIALAAVGMLTARLQKQRFIVEDFISVALIVFGMVILAETILAIQMAAYHGDLSLQEIWFNHRQVALSSAILTSLWAPAIYYPLNRWWQFLRVLEQA